MEVGNQSEGGGDGPPLTRPAASTDFQQPRIAIASPHFANLPCHSQRSPVFSESRHTPSQTAPTHAMTTSAALLKSIQSSSAGLTLAGLLAQHPGLARRTVQRWMSQWVAQGLVTASGEGRARRYGAPAQPALASAIASTDRFPQTAGTSSLMSISRCRRASRWAISMIFWMPTSPT